MIRRALALPALAAAVLSGGVGAATAAPAPTGLAARVQRLEDIEAIRELLTNYGLYLDRRDFDAYSALFARDGEWIGGFPVGKGREAIRRDMDKALGPKSSAVWTSHHHLMTNMIIHVDGDTATAWSRWSFVAPSDKDTPVVMYSGRYEDDLVREDGAWKFRRRVVSGDIPGPKAK